MSSYNIAERKLVILKISDEIGISKAADLFNHSRKSIITWRNEFQKDGIDGLLNKSRNHQKYKNKVSDSVVNKIIDYINDHPDDSAKIIKEKLDLKCSVRTVYKKIAQNSHLIKKKYRSLSYELFSDFYVSIGKIEDEHKDVSNKLPTYLMLIEERATGLSFISFSNERTSFSIAVFLEYFIEFLKIFGIRKKYIFHISPAIKLSNNDLIFKIVKTKYNFSVITDSYMKDFCKVRKSIPYKYLYENCFSKIKYNSNLNQLIFKSFAHINVFNYRMLEEFQKHNPGSIYKKRKIEGLISSLFPIKVDGYISNIDEIKTSKQFFTDLSPVSRTSGYYNRIHKINQSLLYLIEIAKSAETGFQYIRAEELFSTIFRISEYHLNEITDLKNAISYKVISRQNQIIIEDLVKSLVVSIVGLHNSFKLKGHTEEIIPLILEGIKLSEKYELVNEELDLKIILSACYISGEKRQIAFSINRYIINHKEVNEKQYFKALSNCGLYYRRKSKYETAEKIFLKLLEIMGDKLPELKISTLLNLSTIHLTALNKYDSAFSLIEQAKKLSKINKIHFYEVFINICYGMYYKRTGNFNLSVTHYKKGIKLSEERGYFVNLKGATSNLGDNYRLLGKYNEALMCFKSVLPSLDKKIDYNIKIPVLRNICRVYVQLKKYEVAEEYADQAIILSKLIDNDNQYYHSLNLKYNIAVEKLELKKAMVMYDIFIKEYTKIRTLPIFFNVKLLYYNSYLLKIIYSIKLTKKEMQNREECIISIFENISSDFESTERNDPKFELAYLYCRLFKFLYDNAEINNLSLTGIRESGRINYEKFKKIALKMLKEIYSESPEIYYRDKINELMSF